MYCEKIQLQIITGFQMVNLIIMLTIIVEGQWYSEIYVPSGNINQRWCKICQHLNANIPSKCQFQEAKKQ